MNLHKFRRYPLTSGATPIEHLPRLSAAIGGMIDMARKGYFPAGSKVLYAHLGRAPALNGYSYYSREG